LFFYFNKIQFLNKKSQFMSVLGIIPARYQSSRFPGKPLVKIAGKSMIQRVYEQVGKYKGISFCTIATDDQRIFDHCLTFTDEVVMTSPNHLTGTDRCIEALNSWIEQHNEQPNYVVNIQGDEPFIHPTQLQLVHQCLLNTAADVATLVFEETQTDRLFDVNVVKVVKTKNNRALYFSRQAIPFVRNQSTNDWATHTSFFSHIGLYGFKTEVLLQLKNLKPSALELAESLEQLRWMENGFDVYVAVTDRKTVGIDTPEDLDRLRL